MGKFHPKHMHSPILPQVWVQQSSVVPNEFITELEQCLTDQYTQTWQGEPRNTSGKIRMYKLIKEDFKREGYLTLPPYLRVPLTRLRTCSHTLRIETGWYNLPTSLPVEERICWLCTDSDQPLVEDELHFLFHCSLYTQEKQDFTNIAGYQARTQGGGVVRTNPPSLASQDKRAALQLVLQQRSLMIFTENGSITTHSAALQVEWLLHVNCYIPPQPTTGQLWTMMFYACTI